MPTSLSSTRAATTARIAPERRALFQRLQGGIILLLLISLALLWLVPFFFLAMTSVRSQGELLSTGVFALPQSIHLENYVHAWRTGHFETYYTNSITITLIKVPLGVLIASLAAYPLAKLQFRFRELIFIAFLLGLTIPIYVTLLPLFIILREIGILNTLAALLPPYIAFGLPFQIFVMRGFFRGIPTELAEAARIDGASEWTVFARIMVPLAKPALATLFIIDSLHTWNEFLMALVFINADRWRTVPLGLLHFQGEFGSHYPQLTAGILLACAPILVLYLLFQRYLVSGLTAGALKG